MRDALLLLLGQIRTLRAFHFDVFFTLILLTLYVELLRAIVVIVYDVLFSHLVPISAPDCVPPEQFVLLAVPPLCPLCRCRL